MVWVVFAIALVLGASALVAVIGAVLPAQHTVSRKALFNRTPQEIWDVVSDFPAQVSWRSDIGHVERLARRGAHPVWREVDRRGQALILETVEALPPRRLVRRVTDNRMFGGDWTYEIAAYGEVASLTVTENGEVYSPVVRFISRSIMGHTSTIDNYLRALGQELGTDVTITSA